MSETLSAAIPDDIDALARTVLEGACDRKATLVTAESCTGGLLASLLTDVEGCSHAFERGFVTYSDEAKSELLGVPAALIKKKGAVSREVAEAMASGALRASQGAVAIAITGFAGPAAEDDETGLVHLACATRDGTLDTRELHLGEIGRGPVRVASLRAALEMLRDAVLRNVRVSSHG